jgi:hypothetical protein
MLIDDHTMLRHVDCPKGKVEFDGEQVWPEFSPYEEIDTATAITTLAECDSCGVKVEVYQFA